jgi:tetratricopeptide (TPR) repeat protein
MGDLRTAKRVLRQAGGLKPDDAGHHFARARVACLDGRWDEAPAMLRRSLDKEPHTASAQCWLGYVHWSLGEHDAAQTSFTQCHANERLSPWGWISAAWLDILQGKPVAESIQKKLQTLHHRDPRVPPLNDLLKN